MPILAPLYKLSWGGRLFTKEQWNCSVHILKEGAENFTAEDYAASIAAFHVQSGAMISSAAMLDYVKFNAIDPVTGKYVSTTFSDTHFLPVPIAGIDTPAPGQNSVAASLTTDLQRGRGHMGRIYLPTGSQPLGVDVNGQMSTGVAVTIASAVAVLLNSMNNIGGGKVCVFSKIGQLTVPVTAVKCGRVVDTQRRRRSSLDDIHVLGSPVVT